MQAHGNGAAVEADHLRRLRRGRRTWNLLARIVPRRIGEGPGNPLRALALEHLRLQPGEAVLDVGCGAGALLVLLREHVGSAGRVVGVDVSPRMLERSRRLLARSPVSGVELVLADASRDPLGAGTFEAAVAIASLSATPNPRHAITNVYGALRPGGRLFVFDMRLRVGLGRRRHLVRLARWAYDRLAGFTGEDVLVALQETFDEVEIVVADDWVLLAVARKGGLRGGMTPSRRRC